LCGGDGFAVCAFDVPTGLPCAPVWLHNQRIINHILLSPDKTAAFTAAGLETGPGSVNRWPLPKPWPDDPETVSLRVQVLTGECWNDELKAPQRLTVAEWDACRKRLRELESR
jgi:hypothetical protein